MHHQYAHPAVHEALAEFYFDSPTPWDDTYVGLFYQAVRNEYPVKEQRITNQASVEQQGGPQIGMRFEMTKRFIAKREDATALLQVSPNLLVVNQLQPYQGWPVLRDRTKSALDTYTQVCSPSRIRRVGLRYLNRFELPSGPIELEDFFNFYPHLPHEGPLSVNMNGFLAQVVFPYADGRDSLRLNLRPAPDQNPEKSSVMFDLYYSSAMLDTVEKEVVLAWLEDAHEAVSAAFEATVTGRLRELLEAGS